MEIKKKDLQRKIETMVSKKYKSRLGDAGFITFFGNTTGIAYTFGFRLQFDCMLTFTGFTVVLEKLEHFFSNLLLDELGEYYDNEMVFSCYEFYPQKYEFVQEITSEAHLEEFLSEFYKCLSYYEQEVFPKLLDIKFLADYVGSVPFERKAEIAVGGSFPVHLFKKIAILKWGNHSRYEEYKNETLKLIDLYGIKKPEKTEEVAIFKQGFDYLITHLENEPNPFVNE